MARCSTCGGEMQQGAKFCKSCGAGLEAGNSDKKARVMAGASRSPKTAIIVGVAAVLVMAGWFVYSSAVKARSIERPMMMTQAERSGNSSENYAPVKAENGEVKVPLGSLQGTAARYFVYSAGGKEIKFFVVRATDGTVRAALDACQACYHAKLGYRQNGDTLVCNNCGMSFRSTDVGHVTGGCSPIPLRNSQDGTTMIVKASDLEEGVKYF